VSMVKVDRFDKTALSFSHMLNNHKDPRQETWPRNIKGFDILRNLAKP